jgi:hypothetical protein
MVSRSVDDVAGALAAVERGLADPGRASEERRRVAADLFYRPGSATARAVRELYEVIELEPAAPAHAAPAGEDQWPQSA